MFLFLIKLYFTFSGESALCNTCGNKLSAKQSNITGLRKHIQTQQEIIHRTLKKEDKRRSQVEEELDLIEAGLSGSTRVVTFKPFNLQKKAVTKKWLIQDQRQLVVDHEIITLIATECR